VALPGQDFILRREYSSKSDLDGPNIVGNNWVLPVTRMVTEPVTGELVLHGNVRGNLRFTDDLTGIYRAHGATTTFAQSVIDSGGVRVWRVHKPGVREVDFYGDNSQNSNVDDDLTGFIRAERDYFGRTWDYDYIDVGPSGGVSKRLRTITVSVDSQVLVIIVFNWIGEHADLDLAGKIKRVEVNRLIEGDMLVLTQWAEYTYAGEVSNLSLDVSDDDHGQGHDSPPDGNLVQVVTGKLVDEFDFAGSGMAPGNSWYPYRPQVTQYRYHASSANAPIGSPFTGPLSATDVDEGRLKAVILPQQIEHFADRWNKNLSPELAIKSAATVLMQKADAWSAADANGINLGFQLIALSAKVIDYDDNFGGNLNVSAQYTLSDCGCGGGSTLGTMDRFEYYTHNNGINGTTRIQRYTPDLLGSYTDIHLTQYFEFTRNNSSSNIPYRTTRAVVSTADQRTWVEVWGLESVSITGTLNAWRNNVYHSPEVYSATNSYIPGAQGVAPIFAPGTTGLVRHYSFNSDRRLIGVGISDGPSGTYIPVKRITYPPVSSGNNRVYLPLSIVWNRNASHTDWSTDDDIETTAYSYGFKGATDELAWVKQTVEAELQAENGPDVVTEYDRYWIYDDFGQVSWTRAEDLSMTFSKRDPVTGRVLKLVRNADITGPAGETEDAFSAPSGLTTTGWGQPGTEGELASVYKQDLLGRDISVTTPAGLTTHTRRGFLRNGTTGNSGVLKYVATLLPPGDTAEQSGPISRTWFDAGGNVLRRSQFLADVSGGNVYNPAVDEYVLGEEVAKAETEYNLAGQRTSSKRWEDVGDDLFPSGGSGAEYETTLAYDELGRVSSVTDPTNTVVEYEYDVLDRVIEQRVGTTTQSSVKVAELLYDADSGAMNTSGVGNGLLTRQKADTDYTYDFRNRLVVMSPPEPPYSFTQYDNLNRVVASAVYEDASLTVRGRYDESEYSQRGRMVRSRVAIDPTNISLGFLESNMWYDEKGRVLKQLSPDSPATKYEYDQLDRMVVSSVTDGRNDSASGTSGGHTDAGDLPLKICTSLSEGFWGKDTRGVLDETQTTQYKRGDPQVA